MPRRCAILTSFDPYSFHGGIETYTRHLVHLLQSQGIQVDIYHTGNLPPQGEGLSSSHLFHSRFLNDLYPVGRFFYRVDRLYDFVIAHAFFGFGYCPPRIPAFNIFHSTHAQYAEDNRELFPLEWYLEVKYLFGLGAERLSTIGRKSIAVSDPVARELTQHYRPANVTTVWTGVDRTIFFPRQQRRALREKFNIPINAFVGAFLARWDRDKEAGVMTKIIESTPDVFWLLVLGSGATCPLRGQANIKTIENVAQPVVAEILSLSDFLLHPSRYEGFGLAVIEAMACGLPVIAAPAGVVRAVYTEEPLRSLLLPTYKSGAAQVIAAALEKIHLLRIDLRLRNAASAAGLREVVDKFDRSRWEANLLTALGIQGEPAPVQTEVSGNP